MQEPQPPNLTLSDIVEMRQDDEQHQMVDLVENISIPIPPQVQDFQV